MLRNLHIKNLALIREMDVDFAKGLNILTGETGAGKSIIIDSITLALGGKMSREMIREQAPFALVELLFEVENPKIEKQLEAQDIFLEDGVLLISRKIMDGRSVSKINGETCTVAQVRSVASLLLDIHGQHEHQTLLQEDAQLNILDEYGKEKIAPAKRETAAAYEAYAAVRRELAATEMDESQRLRQVELLEYEIQEIEDAALQPGEDEDLERQYRKLTNSKKIAESLQQVHGQTGYENGQGAGDQIGMALHALNGVLEYDEELSPLASVLTDVDSMLNDFNRELSAYLSELTFSAEEFAEVENRLDTLNHLKSKYGKSLDAVLEYKAQRQEELQALYDYETSREKMNQKCKYLEEELKVSAHKLTVLRKSYGTRFETKVKEQLEDLNFLHVDFALDFSEKEAYTENGIDHLCFMISTNPGEARRPLNKVVSGGELSRIMLAIKTLLAELDETETLIFDEIDTGISGRTAQKVSEKMALTGHHHQVLCITHLPQIAAMADVHYAIEKKVVNGETITSIEPLNEDEITKELARMLGGTQITQRTLESAREMKEMAAEQKNTRVK
ncbi:MAG: DNA repair protein RecN [Lachnospiraceae bacterium]|nr:DNA repair protein RecN [Lachnospiraceae bacterium]